MKKLTIKERTDLPSVRLDCDGTSKKKFTNNNNNKKINFLPVSTMRQVAQVLTIIHV